MKGSTIQAVTSDTALTEGARLVLLALFSFANAQGLCWPGNAKLRQVLGDMPEPTLNRHLAKLREAGAIEANYDRHARRRTFKLNIPRYAPAPITSDSCTADAPITSDSRTYHQREVHLSPVSGAPITSDRPNKKRPEKRPENAPRNGGATVGSGLDCLSEDEPFTPGVTPEEQAAAEARARIVAAGRETFADRLVYWLSDYAGSKEYTDDPDRIIAAIKEAKADEVAGIPIDSLGGYIRRKWKNAGRPAGDVDDRPRRERKPEPIPPYLMPFPSYDEEGARVG
jgi:DNA-binding transcriptional ArsR family regulator